MLVIAQDPITTSSQVPPECSCSQSFGNKDDMTGFASASLALVDAVELKGAKPVSAPAITWAGEGNEILVVSLAEVSLWR